MSAPNNNLIDRVSKLEAQIVKQQLLVDDLLEAMINIIKSHGDKR